MSTSLQVYAVPFARLQDLRSGREERLLAAVLRERDADIVQIDQQTQENVAEELEGYPEFLACGTALHQIFTGASLNPELGAVYIQAYRLICEALAGDPVGEWSPIAAGSGAFFQRLDGWLKECCAGVTLVNLTCRGPVIAVPEAIDFPSVGYWTPEEIGQAARALQRTASWWPWSRKMPPADLADSVADIRRWLEGARRNTGQGLVGVQTY